MRYVKETFMLLETLALYLIQHWYITVPVLIVLLCLPPYLRWLRVIFSNLLYAIRLLFLCKKKHLTAKLCKSGLKIGNGSKTIRVCFLWSNLRKKNLYLFDSETAYINRTYIQLMTCKFFGLFGGWKGFNKYETALKQIYLPETYGELSFVVVNPAPLDVFVFSDNAYRATGSGVQVENKTFYFGKALISFLSRKEDLNT